MGLHTPEEIQETVIKKLILTTFEQYPEEIQALLEKLGPRDKQRNILRKASEEKKELVWYEESSGARGNAAPPEHGTHAIVLSAINQSEKLLKVCEFIAKNCKDFNSDISRELVTHIYNFLEMWERNPGAIETKLQTTSWNSSSWYKVFTIEQPIFRPFHETWKAYKLKLEEWHKEYEAFMQETNGFKNQNARPKLRTHLRWLVWHICEGLTHGQILARDGGVNLEQSAVKEAFKEFAALGLSIPKGAQGRPKKK